MWIWKCRECGKTFTENEKLPMKENPSGIMQEVCSNCYGALDLVRQPTPRAADGACACAIPMPQMYQMSRCVQCGGQIPPRR